MKLNERLAYLGEILINLAASPIPSHQFQALADQAGTVIPCGFLAVCLLNPDERSYQVHTLLGDLGNLISPRSFALNEGIAGLTMRTGRTTLCDDISQHPHNCPDLEGNALRLNLRSMLVVPLRQGERVLGALYFAAQPPVVYDLDDLQIGTLLAAGLSTALESAHLYQSVADERSVLAAVLGSSKDAVIVVGAEGIVLLANPAMGEALRQETQAMIGHPAATVVTQPQLRELLVAPGEETTAEIELLDGRVAQASLIDVTTPLGEKVGRAAILRDITLLKELERMKSEFVQTVSHDLKNPISSIILATELLTKSGELNAQQQDLSRRILDTSYFMDALVSDLLDLGQIEARLGLKIAPLDLAGLARAVMADLYPRAMAKHIELTLEAADRVSVSGDSQRLRQVLMNLIENAIKYTPAGGAVTVTIETNGAVVVTQVRDNGIGIPATSQPHVFEKFYRVRSEATAGISGTGLGLAIARSIIDAHRGRIWLESSEGKGSTFAFSLPA